MRRRQSRTWLWSLGGAVVLVAAVAVVLALRFGSREEILEPSWTPPTLQEARTRLEGKTFAEFADEAYRIHLLRHPQTVTDLGLAEKLGIRDDRLDDYSNEYVRTTLAIDREIYRRLHTYNRESLTPDERLTYDACEALWKDLTTCEAPALSLFPVSASDDSPHARLYTRLISVWRLVDEEDVADYVACLHQADDQLLQLRDRIVDLRARHRLPPVASLDEVLRQVEPLKITEMWSRSEYLPDRIVAGHNVYFVALRDRLIAIRELGVEKRVKYLTEAKRALEQEVIPAYEKLYGAVVAALAEAPSADVGIRRRDGGGSAYEGLLRHYTGSDLDPETIHAMGQDAATQIAKEIAVVEEQAKTPSGRDVSAAWSAAAWDGGSPSPDDIAAACRAVLERADAFGSRFAGHLPKATISVLLGEGPRGYMAAPYDGSRSALLVVDPGAPWAVSDVAAFVHRETVPGRHLQRATARELALPAIRAWGGFPAFEEGWSAYALGVAGDVGLYDGDPLANLGRLHSQLREAALAVVDTGVHALGWSFDRAVNYYVDATGDEEGSARMAVKGCVSSPGRATAGVVGSSRLRALRDAARRASGASFDLAAFHDLVLGRGLLPLSIVEREVRKDLRISDSG
ncbi:MAG: DUF885 domain-containing protein [Candidatus Bipolaricaulis sp.]|nr:DUF885 domain-containing protein [Candidatus Bipolaricaulis sp.]